MVIMKIYDLGAELDAALFMKYAAAHVEILLVFLVFVPSGVSPLPSPWMEDGRMNGCFLVVLCILAGV